MDRTTIRSLVVIAAVVLAGAARADVAGDAPDASAAEPSQGFIIAIPPASNAAAASKVAAEPARLPPTEVRAYREDRVPCDRREGLGQEACRAQLAAKYAEMDKLCRIVSGTEIPVCIKSAYAAD
jgi:hypothetical protein